MTVWRRAVSGLVLAALVFAAIGAAALTRLSHLPAWANALITGAAFAAGLILDPFKRLVSDWFERPRQQNAILVGNTRMHDRRGRLQRVRECADATALGVHPAAYAGDELSTSDRLPPYVRRDVQAQLEVIFRIGGVVIIEGASAAGKSRLAFQCMQACAGDRWLVVPIGPDSLREVIQAAVPLRNAVIWLDDLERYFSSGGLDAAVLDGLCPPGSTDVIVLATLRAEARSELNAAGADISIGRAFQEVMQRARIIWLDRALTETETVRARELCADRRIADALDHAAQAGFAEYLAAGPATLDRWESARRGEQPVAGAIISAAIDARRAGCQKISDSMLGELYKLYLSPRIRHRVKSSDFNSALEWATQPVRGASACLLVVTEETYEPFDYLLDHAQRVSTLRDIPEKVWPTLIAHVDVSDLLLLGTIARAAGQSEFGEHALDRAAAMGSWSAMDDLGDLLRETGRPEEAEQWYRRAANAGSSLAVEHLGELLKRSGRPEEAKQWYDRAEEEYRRAGDAGSQAAIVHLGDLLRKTGRPEEAEQCYRRAIAADAEYGYAVIHLGDLLWEADRAEEAEQWYRRAANADPGYPGYHSAILHLGDLLRKTGRPEEAEQCYRHAANAGYDAAIVELGDLLRQTGHAEEAEQWYRRAANAGYRLAMYRVGDLLQEAGHAEEAEQWYRHAANAGYDLAMVRLGDLLREAGHAEEAEQWYRRAITADPEYDLAMVHFGDLLWEADRAEEAEQWYRRAADAGYRLAMYRLSDLLRQTGRLEEAEQWYRCAADAG